MQKLQNTGSVIIAGVLVKLGSYRFSRFSLALFPFACIYFSTQIFIDLISNYIRFFNNFRENRFIKIIAYSSISHLGFGTLGIFFIASGIEGSKLIKFYFLLYHPV